MNNLLIDIVLCIDNNVIEPSLVLIRSILDTTLSKVKFNILLEKGLMNKFNQLIKKNKFIDRSKSVNVEFNIIEFKPPQSLIDILDKYNKIRYYRRRKIYVNLSNFSRFYVSKYFPKLEKYIYLDVDTICCYSIDYLYTIFNDKKHNIAAVPFEKYDKLIRFSHSYMKDKQYLKKIYYFNAGVYVTNNQYWIKNNITEKIENIMKINSQRKLYKGGTQTPLNLVFPSYQKLPDKFNWITKAHNIHTISNKTRIYIIHFKGRTKPWINLKKINSFYAKKWSLYRSRITL